VPATALHQESKLQTPLKVESNLTESKFHSMVDQAIEYIRAGEIFQVVLGQSFSMPFDLPGFSLYRSLRHLNPSPFLFYFNFGGFQIVGSSPEILVRVRGRRVTIRPIAGTRRRGKTGEEDRALAEELLADPKERAEHLMLLDLGRNDVGRVAKTGSVKVTERFVIERYSHVMHIVSNVEGDLREDLDSLDALFSGFPAGTVSGAPKVRAMQIIEELEPTRRGYYGGCIGYLDGNGDLDTCIALRTALVKDGKVYVQASGGIVADSKPDFEFNESVIKARAIVQAADQAVSHSRQPRQQKA
jgi:anthranilate synthase component 1